MDNLAKTERNGNRTHRVRRCPSSEGPATVLANGRTTYREGEEIQKIDMEPFDILTGMLRDPEHSPTIGGAPQLIKVYQYIQAESFRSTGRTWNRAETFSKGGPVLDTRISTKQIVDPDNQSWPTQRNDSELDMHALEGTNPS
jgi:hypothetical protein